MSIMIIGPILAIFIILIPFIKSIVQFNRFFNSTEGAVSLKTTDNLYQSILDAEDIYEINNGPF